jgi:hypothetical protein
MSIQYTYEVVKVDEAARCMEVVYTADGHQTMHIGARLPFEGESLESVVRQFAPLAYWEEQQLPVVVPVVGTSGTLAPPVTSDAQVEDPGYVAIFPTPATGALGATIFK